MSPGDRVAIWSPNTHHWVLGALGALHAGAMVVPVNTRFTGHEAADVIARSGARALLVAGPFLGVDRFAALREAQTDRERRLGGGPSTLHLIITVPDHRTRPCLGRRPRLGRIPGHRRHVPAAEADARAAAVSPDDVSDILFTSGTTGRSKGAMRRTARRSPWPGPGPGSAASAPPTATWWSTRSSTASDSRPASWPAWSAGRPSCRSSVYGPARAMAPGRRPSGSLSCPGRPTIYQTILDHPGRPGCDLSSLRLAVTGAATVPLALVERMQRELSFETVLTAYGLTEAVVATMCRPGDDPQHGGAAPPGGPPPASRCR